jgi:hypothetical protein
MLKNGVMVMTVKTKRMKCAFCNSFMTAEEIETYHYAVSLVGSIYPICERCDQRKTPTHEVLSIIEEEVG